MRALNGGDQAVSLEVSTPFGTKSFAGVAAGKSAQQTFATRVAAIEAGEVTVTVQEPAGPVEVVARYAATDCAA